METTDAGEDVEKQEHFYTVGGSVNSTIVEDSVAIPQGPRYKIPFDPAIPLLGIQPKDYESFYYKDTCTCMFIATPFTILKTWNQPTCPLTIDWTRKMWHIYTMEYQAAIKNDEFVSFVGTWMNLETIILSKLTQEQKIKPHMFSLIGRC